MLSIILALTGCTLRDEPNLAEGPSCVDNAVVVELDEVTELGFTPQQLLDLAMGEHAGTVAWNRGSDASIELALSEPSEARFIDSEVVEPEGDGEHLDLWVECPDRVEVDLTLDLSTDDGWFDESWEIALVGFDSAQARFDQELDLDDLVGSFDVEPDVTSPDYDALSAWVTGSFVEGSSAGAFEGQASGEDDCEDGDECSAWAELVEIGTWQAAPRLDEG
jgi:hypothetical protein